MSRRTTETQGGQVTAVCRTITFPEDVSDRLTKQAEAEDRPLSRIVTAAVRVYLDSRETANA